MRRPHPARLLSVVVASLAVATGAAGCGDDDQAGSGTGSGVYTSTPTPGDGKSVDAAFIRQMAAHHLGAVEMARTAEKRAEHDELKALADKIIRAQERELEELQALARKLDVDLTDAAGKLAADAETMEQSAGMMGMSTKPGALDDADPFDLAFIDEMIAHHTGALGMAHYQYRKGSDPRVKRLANKIVRVQQREITTMGGWRNTWFPKAPAPDPTADDGHMGHGK